MAPPAASPGRRPGLCRRLSGPGGHFGLIGPTSDSKGTLLFMGGQLPLVKTMTQTRMALVTDPAEMLAAIKQVQAEKLQRASG